MKIYNLTELSSSTYICDRLIPKPSVGLPGVKCDACGQTWADGMARIPKDLPNDHPLRSRKRWPVPVAELNFLRADVRMALNLPLDTPLPPGADIGIIDFLCKDSHLEAFEWPAVHVLVVREDVVEFLQEHKIAGWEVAPIRVEGTRYLSSIPSMYQLLVNGNGGVPVTDPPVEKISHCDVCGRTEFKRKNPRTFQMDISQWDGSDIFRFDPPYQGYMFITDRLADGFKSAGFKNYELSTIEGLLQRITNHVFS